MSVETEAVIDSAEIRRDRDPSQPTVVSASGHSSARGPEPFAAPPRPRRPLRPRRTAWAEWRMNWMRLSDRVVIVDIVSKAVGGRARFSWSCVTGRACGRAVSGVRAR